MKINLLFTDNYEAEVYNKKMYVSKLKFIRVVSELLKQKIYIYNKNKIH